MVRLKAPTDWVCLKASRKFLLQKTLCPWMGDLRGLEVLHGVTGFETYVFLKQWPLRTGISTLSEIQNAHPRTSYWGLCLALDHLGSLTYLQICVHCIHRPLYFLSCHPLKEVCQTGDTWYPSVDFSVQDIQHILSCSWIWVRCMLCSSFVITH